MIEDRAAAHGGENPGGQAESDGEQQRHHRELDGRGEQSKKFADDWLARDDRIAEIALQHAGHVVAVLHEQRVVEMQLAAQHGVAHGVDAALAGHQQNGIAGGETDKGKGQQRDPEEGRDHQAGPGQDETQHVTKTGGSIASPLFRRGCRYRPAPLTP